MVLLLINTAATPGVVTLAVDGTVHERALPDVPALGVAVLGAVDTLLTAAGVTLSDLDRIAVHPGPGRYGAVRQGVVVATLLAASTGAELVAVAGDDPTALFAAAAEATPTPTVIPHYA